LKEDYSNSNTSSYFKEEDLQSSYYNSVKIDSYVNEENILEFRYPIYEPFVGLSRGEYFIEQNKYYQPLTMLIPVKVVDNYKISLKNSVEYDIWNDFVTDKKVITINGDKFYFYVCCTDSLMPAKTEQIFTNKLKLTEK
jgi:hypothetical protein